MLLFFPSERGLGGRWTWIEAAVILIVATLTFVEHLKDVPVTVGGT